MHVLAPSDWTDTIDSIAWSVTQNDVVLAGVISWGYETLQFLDASTGENLYGNGILKIISRALHI